MFIYICHRHPPDYAVAFLGGNDTYSRHDLPQRTTTRYFSFSCARIQLSLALYLDHVNDFAGREERGVHGYIPVASSRLWSHTRFRVNPS